MIIVSGTFRVDPEKRDQAVEVGATMAAASQAEAGCVAYGFWTDPSDPARFRVFEEWESADALDAHFATAHMTTFVAALGGLGVRDTDISRYEASAKSKLM